MYIHIVTVGTSIARNLSMKEDLEESIRSKLREWVFSRPGSKADIEAGERGVPGAPEFRVALEQTVLNPRRISAELNAMWQYLENRRVDKVYLLTTDSGVSYFCARVLSEYLSREWGVESEIYRVEKLGLDFEEGILNLVSILIKYVKKHRSRGDRVHLNATGGFKPETAIMYLIASLIGVDRVYYIHESMRRNVDLPTIPIKIDKSYFKFLPHLEKLEVERVPTNVLEELKRRGVIEIVGGKVRMKEWIRLLLRS